MVINSILFLLKKGSEEEKNYDHETTETPPQPPYDLNNYE